MYCSACGKEISDTVEYCPYCGKKLDTFSDYSDIISEHFNEKVVVAEFGFNSVTNKPFKFLYDLTF